MIFNRTAYCTAFIPTFSSPQSSPNSCDGVHQPPQLLFFSCNSKAFQVLHAADHKALAFVLGNTPTSHLRNPLTIIYIC